MDFMIISGWTAVCLSSCFYFSLSIPFLRTLRCKMNFEYTPIHLVSAIYVDCFSWYIYGLKILSEQIMLASKIGICSTLALMAVYLGFELKKYTVDTILNIIILIMGTLVMQKGLDTIIEDFQIVGKICIGTKLITFYTPMLLLYQVFKEKNFELISLRDTFLYCAASLAWILFGKSTKDIYVMWANSCAFVLCSIQLYVIIYFKRKYSNYNKPTKTIGIETEQNEEPKKEESTSINLDLEKQEKEKEKPVKIVTKIES